MQTFYNYQEYQKYIYKRDLKKDSNKIGLVLILFYVVMTVASTAAVIIPMLGSLFNTSADFSLNDMDFMSDTTFLMLMSGLVSIISFFGVSIIYSMIAKSDLGKIFPLDKIGTKVTFQLCAIGLAVCMIANYVSNILVSLFDTFGIQVMLDTEYNCDSALDIILFYTTVAVLPALVEEFAFRGVILGMLRKYSDGLAVLISGVMFGIMHGNFVQIPFALVVGLVLGYIAVKTNSLLPGIIIHFLNNGLSVTMTLLTTNTDLSDAMVNVIYSCILITICIVGLLSFIALTNKQIGFFKLQSGDNTLEFKEKVKTVCYSPAVIAFIVLSIVEAISMIILAEVSI